MASKPKSGEQQQQANSSQQDPNKPDGDTKNAKGPRKGPLLQKNSKIRPAKSHNVPVRLSPSATKIAQTSQPTSTALPLKASTGLKTKKAVQSQAKSKQLGNLNETRNNNEKSNFERLSFVPRDTVLIPSHSPAFQGVLMLGKQGAKLGDLLHVKEVIVKDAASSSSTASEEVFQHVIEALNCLKNQEYIFMQRLLDFQDVENAGVTFRESNPRDLAYQILSKSGDLMFLMGQHKTSCTSFIIYSKKVFENTLYDLAGNKVLKFVGPTVFMCRMISVSSLTMTHRMEVSDSQGRLLGYIKAFGSRANYSIFNALGEQLYLITTLLRIPSNKSEFAILYRGKPVGKIRNRWHEEHQEFYFIDAQDAGIHFPAHMDHREKTLLMGCMMLIEFHWYSPLTKFHIKLAIFEIILLLCIIVVAGMPILLDEHDDDIRTKSFFLADGLNPT